MSTKYLNESEKIRGQNCANRAEVYNGFGANYLGDTIVFILATYFGASNIVLGFVSSGIYITGVVLPIIPRLLKGKNLQKVHAWFWAGRGFFSLMYVFLFFLEGKAAISLLMFTYFMFCLCRTIGMVFFDNMTKMVSTIQNRGAVFARLTVTYQGFSILAKFLSFIITSIQRFSGLIGLIGLQMFGVFANYFAAREYRKIPCRSTIDFNPKRTLFVLLKEYLSNPVTRVPLFIKWLFLSIFIILNMSIPFMSKIMGLTSSSVLLYTVVNAFGLTLSGVFGRKYVDKIGAKPLIIIFSWLLLVVILLWMFSPTSVGVALFFFYGFSYNFVLGVLLILTSKVVVSIMPDEEIIAFNSMNNFGIAIIAIIVGVLSGLLVDLGELEHGFISLGGFSFGHTYSFCFLLALVMTAVGLILTLSYREKGSLTTGQAAQILFSAHGLRAFSVIEKIERTNDPMKRKMLLMNLGTNLTGVATSEIRIKLASPFSFDKQEIIRALGDKPRKALVGDLAKIALNDDSYVQMDAIAALGGYKDDPVAEEALVYLLDCKWSSVRSMASKSLSRFSDSIKYLDRINKLSLGSRHIDEELDYLIAKKNLDKKGLFFQDFFVPVIQMHSNSFRQTRYALLASFLKFGSPRLAHLYELMNIGTVEDFLLDFLPEARDLEDIDQNYDKLFKAFKEEDKAFILDFVLNMLRTTDVSSNSCMENLRLGILKAENMNINAFDFQDLLAILYFGYSLKKNSK